MEVNGYMEDPQTAIDLHSFLYMAGLVKVRTSVSKWPE